MSLSLVPIRLHRACAHEVQRSDGANLKRQWMNSLWLALIVGTVYFLAAKLSLSLLTPDGVAVFWPAAGVAAGALIALGPIARLAVVVGTVVATIVANLLGDRNLWTAIVFALCNAGEALITAGLIERYFGSGFRLGRPGLRLPAGAAAPLDCSRRSHPFANNRLTAPARKSNGKRQLPKE